MKRIIALFLALFMILALCSCKKDDGSDKKEIYLEYDYDLNEYITFGDPTAIVAEFEDDSVCTESEIDEAVFQVMLSYAQFTPAEGRHAEKNDKVTVSCVASIDDNVIEELSTESLDIVIGLSSNSDISQLLQNELIGKVKGDIVSAQYTYPDNSFYYGDYAGQKVNFRAEVLEVSSPEIYECNDEFVKGLQGFEFKTVADFRESLRADILQAKKDQKVTSVWNAFYMTVEVKKYPEKEYDFYYDDYRKYYEETAEECGISLEEYLNEYFDGMTLEELETESVEYAEYMTKNDMALILLVQKLGTEISEEEYQKGLAEYFEEEKDSFDSLEEFVENYGERNLRRNVLWDKALLHMTDMAIKK